MTTHPITFHIRRILFWRRRARPEAYYERRASGTYTIWLWLDGAYHKVSKVTDRRTARDICADVAMLDDDQRRSVIRVANEPMRLILRR